MKLPNDPIILLSYVNTQLRDHYATLEEFCKTLHVSPDDIISKLNTVDYHYHPEQNHFRQRVVTFPESSRVTHTDIPEP